MAPPEVPPLVTRSIVATSWSKSLALPGERIGYLALSPRMPEAARAVRGLQLHQPGARVRQRARALAVGRRRGRRPDRRRRALPEKRDLIYEGLTRIGYRCVKPQGAFYVFPHTPIDDDVAFVRLLAEEGVLTVPGSGFGCPGHIRISLTVPADTIVRSMPGFAKAFERAHAAR